MAFITTKQIKAARALLNWSQEDLADQAALNVNQVRGYESGRSSPKDVLESIYQCFIRQGIVFSERGVDQRDTCISTIEGPDWFSRLMDDVYFTLKDKKDGELLIECGDERHSSQAVVERVRKIRKAGIKMRVMVEEGNSFLMGPLNEYRYLPKERFNNYVSMIYGDKFAVCTDNNTRATVFKDPSLAKTRENIFYLLWDILKQPTVSTAHERY